MMLGGAAMPGRGRSMGRATTTALFAALALAIVSAAPAHAGRIIIISPPPPPGGGITPVGDPIYTFTVSIGLNFGFAITPGASITLQNVPGVDPTSFYSVPNVAGPGLPAGDGWLTNPTVTSTTGTWPGIDGETPIRYSDVKWTLVGGTPINNIAGSTVLALGLFSINTYQAFSELPPDFQLHLNYIYSLADGSVADSGTVTLALVPEPTSLALLGLGVALPAAVAMRRRRRAAA